MQRLKHFKNLKRHSIGLSVFMALTVASGLPQSNPKTYLLNPSGFAINTVAQLSQGLGLVSTAAAQSTNSSQNTQLSSEQLQSLVSSIALYPDSLLSMMLMASTYPLEVAEAYNWLGANKTLSRTEIQNAMKTQTWDNSIKSLVLFPQALTLMGTKLGWTQQLGNAYLAQPKQLMDAVQALRAKAKQAGNLKSNSQVNVSTEQSNIIIAPANPQVIYVPQYNPTVVYGGWPYPAYPPAPVYNPGWGLMTFGVGLAVGAALWSSPHWNSGSININNNNFNNFNRNVNSNNNIKNNRIGDNSNWRPNATNRGNVQQSQREAAARTTAARDTSDWDKNATPADRQRAQQDANRARSSSTARGFDNSRSDDAMRSNTARSDGGDRSFGGGDHRSTGGGRSFGGFGGGHFGGGFRR